MSDDLADGQLAVRVHEPSRHGGAQIVLGEAVEAGLELRDLGQAAAEWVQCGPTMASDREGPHEPAQAVLTIRLGGLAGITDVVGALHPVEPLAPGTEIGRGIALWQSA